ncbi:hypothetical protein RSAG8_04065, partial [Rhizoctonia solani AG-8 WAC10335]
MLTWRRVITTLPNRRIHLQPRGILTPGLEPQVDIQFFHFTKVHLIFSFCHHKMANHTALFSTNDVRDWNKPQLENSKEFSTAYPATHFPIGINAVDYDKSKNIRIKSYFDSVKYNEKDSFGAKCHLDGWYDSIMYSAGCTWLEHYHDRAFQSGLGSVKPTQEYTTVDVKFESEYASTPKVVCWLRAFDLDKDSDWRIDVTPTDITTKGCKLKFRVWGSTKAFWIEASWTAFPADRSDIECGSFDTQEQRPWEKPQHEHHKKPNIFPSPKRKIASSEVEELEEDEPPVKKTARLDKEKEPEKESEKKVLSAKECARIKIRPRPEPKTRENEPQQIEDGETSNQILTNSPSKLKKPVLTPEAEEPDVENSPPINYKIAIDGVRVLKATKMIIQAPVSGSVVSRMRQKTKQ